MKSAFFATIFVIVGGVAMLLAFPAEDKRAVYEFRKAKAELGLPPQIEDDVAVSPEPEQYSIVQVKPKIRTTASRHRHVARRRPNFLEKLFVSFVNLQKHQPAKTATKRSHTVSPEPVEQYSNVHVKPKIRTTTPRHRHVARRRPNFLEKLFVSFVNPQKQQPAKRATKRSHTTSRRG